VLISVDEKKRPSVSIDLNVSYIGSISLNEEIFIDCQVLKVGGNLAFTNCVFRKDGKILIEGKHTKFLLKSNL
jgi:acyl-coenzyme A thioesterase PaaI-like protein